MFCSQCGTSVSVSAKFCNSCGGRLSEGEVKVAPHNHVTPQQKPADVPPETHEYVANMQVNQTKSTAEKNKIQKGGSLKSGICLHCGFNGDMAVDTVIVPGHETWKGTLIAGIIFLIVFLVAVIAAGRAEALFMLLFPSVFFLLSAYSYNQRLACFHCSRCQEISYKAKNGTWSKEKDTRKWYAKAWSDSSLPTYQKIVLFVLSACIIGLLRVFLKGLG